MRRECKLFARLAELLISLLICVEWIYRFIDAARTDFIAIVMSFFFIHFFSFSHRFSFKMSFEHEFVMCIHSFRFSVDKKSRNVNNTGGDLFLNFEYTEKKEVNEYIVNLVEWEISMPVAKQYSQKKLWLFSSVFLFFHFIFFVVVVLVWCWIFLANFTFHIWAKCNVYFEFCVRLRLIISFCRLNFTWIFSKKKTKKHPSNLSECELSCDCIRNGISCGT